MPLSRLLSTPEDPREPRRRAVRRLTRLASLTTLTLVLGALVSTGATPRAQDLQPASVDLSQSWSVPAGGTLQLTGHGYGHGHGMSQYGAQGAAKQGLGYAAILGFYYPGTNLATVDGPIRVSISADTDDDLQVLTAPGLAVRDLASGLTAAVPANGAGLWRLRAGGRVTVVDYFAGGWKQWTTLGEQGAEFFGPGIMTLRMPSGDRAYRGMLRFVDGVSINVVDIDDYTKGVVPTEMPASWHPEAVRAQAVAARTYGVRSREDHTNKAAQICDTTSCQVYRGASAEDSRSNAAVDATRGQVLQYGGKSAFTQFSSSSGGWTSAGSVPYLVAKADPYDGHTGNPVHTWTLSLTAAAVQQAYPQLGALQRVRVTRRDGNGDWGGRIEQMVLDGSKTSVALSGSAFRSKFGLRSQWFTFGGTPATSTPGKLPPAASMREPVMQRWTAIGGNASALGRPVGTGTTVRGGYVQKFARGRIFYKPSTGAFELHGAILRTYLKRGGPKSRFGFPRSAPTRTAKGYVARFERGSIEFVKVGKRWRIRTHRR